MNANCLLRSTIVLFLLHPILVGAPPTPPPLPQPQQPPMAADERRGEEELLLVQALWRHGDRTPVKTWKTDPYQVATWPKGFEQLTPEGMHQQLVLGRRLRERYIDELQFVGPHYDPRQVHVRSTDTDRTLASATANMNGFFGGKAGGARRGVDFPSDENWPSSFVPIPVHIHPSQLDPFQPDNLFCARHWAIQMLARATPEFGRLFTEHIGLFTQLSKYTGQKIDPYDLYWFVDTIRVERQNNRTMPAWLTPELETVLYLLERQLQNWHEGMHLAPYMAFDFQTELRRLRGGPILWTMIEAIEGKLRCLLGQGPDSHGKGLQDCETIAPRRYIAYSAHEVSISGLFLALGMNTNVDKNEPPPYAACITVELWRRRRHHTEHDDDYYIRIFYFPSENVPLRELTPLLLPKPASGTHHQSEIQKGNLWLDAFLQIAQRYRPEPNVEAVCANTTLLAS